MSGEPAVSDETLWRKVVNGDGDSFGVLFDRHRDRVFHHALRVVTSAHTAEDITAIVFYEAWRRREYVRMINSSIIAWLLVTTNNTIRNHARRQRRYKQFLEQLPAPQSQSDIADDVTDTDERELQTMILRKAFAQLKPSARDVLTLCVVEGFSTRDASTALGIAEGTVKSRLHRAKSQLGNLYEEVSSTREPVGRPVHGRKTS